MALTVGIPRGLSRRLFSRDGTVDTTVLVLNRPDHDSLNPPVNASAPNESAASVYDALGLIGAAFRALGSETRI